MMQQLADDELMRKYREGEALAMDEFLRRYKNPVYRFAFRLCLNAEEAPWAKSKTAAPKARTSARNTPILKAS